MSHDQERKKRGVKNEKYKSSHCTLFGIGKCKFGSKCIYFHDGADDYNELKKNGYNPPFRSSTLSKLSYRGSSLSFSINKNNSQYRKDYQDIKKEEKEEYNKEINTLKKLVIDMKYKITNLETTIDNIKHIGGYKVPLITSVDSSQKEYLGESSTFRWMWSNCTCGIVTCNNKCEYDKDTSEFLEMVLNLKKKTILSHLSLDKDENKKKIINKYNIKIASHIYTIDIQKMTQTNQATKKKRDIYREIKMTLTKNPRWIIHAKIEHQLHTFKDQFVPSYKSDLLAPSSSLFLSIEKDFLDTVNGEYASMRSINARVEKIFKVSNPEAAKLYEFKKQSMEDKTEAMLFHGTRQVNPEEVSRDGLDSRISNGGYFGRGIYTSRSPRYCHEGYVSIIDGYYVVLYVKALLGKIKIYDKNSRDHILVRAPATYDSVCCDVDIFSTTIHTLYDKSQVYVSFIIYYKI
jgi:hypothetical protein